MQAASPFRARSTASRFRIGAGRSPQGPTPSITYPNCLARPPDEYREHHDRDRNDAHDTQEQELGNANAKTCRDFTSDWVAGGGV